MLHRDSLWSDPSLVWRTDLITISTVTDLITISTVFLRVGAACSQSQNLEGAGKRIITNLSYGYSGLHSKTTQPNSSLLKDGKL